MANSNHALGAHLGFESKLWAAADKLRDTYWLNAVWDPLGKAPELMRIQDPIRHLDHADRKIVAARYYDIRAEAMERAARSLSGEA